MSRRTEDIPSELYVTSYCLPNPRAPRVMNRRTIYAFVALAALCFVPGASASAFPAFGRLRTGARANRCHSRGSRGFPGALPRAAAPADGGVSAELPPRPPPAAEVRRASDGVERGAQSAAKKGAAVIAVAAAAAGGGVFVVSRKKEEENGGRRRRSDGESEFNAIVGVDKGGDKAPERGDQQPPLQNEADDIISQDGGGINARAAVLEAEEAMVEVPESEPDAEMKAKDDELSSARSRTEKLLLQFDDMAESPAATTEVETDPTETPRLTKESLDPEEESNTEPDQVVELQSASPVTPQNVRLKDESEEAGGHELNESKYPSAVGTATDTTDKTVSDKEELIEDSMTRNENMLFEKHAEKSITSEEVEQNVGDYATTAREALDNLQLCYRAAFFGVAVDVVLAFWDEDLLSRQWTLLDGANAVDSLSLLGFGVGVLRVWRYLGESLDVDAADLDSDSLIDALRSMKGAWFYATCSLVAGSMATVADLGPYGPASVASLALLGAVAIAARSSSRSAESSGGGTLASPPSSGMTVARSEGLAAVRNMDICAGVFGLYGLAQLAALVASPDSLAEKAIAMTDVLEEGTILGLLGTLAEKTRPVIFDLTAQETSGNETMYLALYEAKKGAYSSIGETIFFASAFALLASLYNGIAT